MPRRVLEGDVVSDKMDKTITVLVERRFMHPLYKKYVKKTDKVVVLGPKSNSRFAKQIWPTMRTLVQNVVDGVTEGYSKKLEIKGVGLRGNLQGNTLVMSLGFSHEVRYDVPEGVTVKMDGQTNIEVSGIDKQKVGQAAAKIRGFKPPEPYKGKGIRYADEYVVRKEGKKK